VWDAHTGEVVRTLTGHTYHVNSVCFSPLGVQLASGSSDTTIKVWDTHTGEVVRTLTGHTNWVDSVCFSPSGDQLASGSCDKTIKVWDAHTGEAVRTLTLTVGVGSVCFPPVHAEFLASDDHNYAVRIYRV